MIMSFPYFLTLSTLQSNAVNKDLVLIKKCLDENKLSLNVTKTAKFIDRKPG